MKGPLNNKWLQLALVVVLVQQMLVASGTFFLGELASQFPISGFNTILSVFLFFCIFLPGTVVHYWVVWFTVKALRFAQFAYLNQYVEVNHNNPTHWKNENSKHMKHDIMCRGGQDAIQAAISFFVDTVATSLNIIFNTVAIILVTDVMMGIIIITAGVLGIGVIYLAQHTIAECSRNEMLADNNLNAHLSRSWDNIVLGNVPYYERWKQCFHSLFFTAENTSLQLVRRKDWAVSVAAMVTNGIVLGGSLFLAWTYQASTSFVLAIFVMLPRSLQIVMHIQIIQSYIARWKNIREKLAIAYDSLIPLQSLDLSDFIQSDAMRVSLDKQNYPVSEIESFLVAKKKGRMTITGPNGVGKSSLLLVFEEQIQLFGYLSSSPASANGARSST